MKPFPITEPPRRPNRGAALFVRMNWPLRARERAWLKGHGATWEDWTEVKAPPPARKVAQRRETGHDRRRTIRTPREDD